MKGLIRKILREETEEKVLTIPGLHYFGNVETPDERFETWNRVLSYVDDRKFKIKGYLNLMRTPIQSLGDLQSVGGHLNLFNTPIQSIGNLQSVGGDLNLNKTPIKSLGNLQSVGGDLYLIRTPIQSLGNLQSVGGNLYLYETPISKKYSEEEIRQMVNVEGEIIM